MTRISQIGSRWHNKAATGHDGQESDQHAHRRRRSTHHRSLPKMFHPRKHVTVEKLSEKLVPIIGKVRFAILIHNLFTPEECNDLIDMAEGLGFEEATILGADRSEALRKEVRNGGRRMVDDAELAEEWFRRVVDALEGNPVLKDDLVRAKHVHVAGHRYDDEDKCQLRVCGLNERLRFLRYLPGQYFAAHQDLSFARGPEFGEREGEKSYLTFLFYLNEVAKGGQTRFEEGSRRLDVVPKVGSVLIFDHDIVHRAMLVISGTKYVCRSDIMYTHSVGG